MIGFLALVWLACLVVALPAIAVGAIVEAIATRIETRNRRK